MRKLTICLLLSVLCAVSVKATTLGTAASFAVLGASTVTNTRPTVLNGNLGLYSGTSITGFPPGIVNGTIYDHDPGGVAKKAQADALTAYNYLAGLSPTQNLTGTDLGGLTLINGVYKFNDVAQLTGQLTLNFQGLSNQEVVFQIGSTLTTGSASSVLITNPGNNDSVFWQVGSSATLGTTTSFQGTILADASITLNTGATIKPCGRALALTGAVTLDTNTISTDGCAAPTPEPGTPTLILLSLGSCGIALLGVRRR